MKKYISNYMLLLITMPLILQSCGVLNTLQKGIDSYNKFAIRTNLENHGFPIYSGDNPPNIEGTFVISTATLEFNSDARWVASKTFADVYAPFTYKKDKDGKEIITYSDICGDANFQSDDVTLSGEENMFTASMVTKGYYNGERKGYIICISGEKTPNGIKNVRYGICIDGAIKEQYRDDKGQQKEREIDVYRIIKDGDDLSELKSVIDERQRKLANEKAEQQRLATIEKQRQDSIVAVREAERQEQLADEKAEQEQIRQTRINNLKVATKPLMEGKWVGG